ncbi:flavodoxin [Bdellovibrionota bacterium FG-1]
METHLNTSKTLIIYFSRTGTTRRVAHVIARITEADLVEVKSSRYPRGIFGYLQAGLDAALSRPVPVDAPSVDFSKYEWVVVGTPVWGSSVSAPIRSYLAKHGRHMRRVAFFITCGGAGARRAFRQMRELAHRVPFATLELRAVDLHPGPLKPSVEVKIRGFAGNFQAPALRQAA